MKSDRWWRQPRTVWVLCLLYGIERASIYGIRFGLVLWLVGNLARPDAQATAIFGAFTVFIFVSHAFAGIITDSGWGFIKTTRLGLLVLAGGYGVFGHALGTSAQFTSIASQLLLATSLALVATGTGLVRISCFSLVGLQYEHKDPRSAIGYNLFYWMENVGVMSAAILAGTIVPIFGLKPTFFTVSSIFGLLFLLSLIVATAPKRAINSPVERRPYVDSDSTGAGRDVKSLGVQSDYRSFALMAAILGVFIAFAMIPGYVWILVLAAIGYAAVFAYRNRLAFAEAAIKAREIKVFLLLTMFSILYSVLLEQQMSSVLLFADRFVDLTILGISFGASNVLMLSPIVIIMVTPLIATYVAWRSGRNVPVSWEGQYALAFSLAASAFMILMMSAAGTDDGDKVALQYLLFAIAFAAIGDALIYPRAFAALSDVAPPSLRGSVSGLWFLCSAVAGYAGGWVAGFSTSTVDGDLTQGPELITYVRFFAVVGIFAFMVAALLLWLRRIWFGAEKSLSRRVRPEA